MSLINWLYDGNGVWTGVHRDDPTILLGFIRGGFTEVGRPLFAPLGANSEPLIQLDTLIQAKDWAETVAKENGLKPRPKAVIQ